MMAFRFFHAYCLLLFIYPILTFDCPKWLKYGEEPPKNCTKPFDPNDKPPSKIEEWLTEDVFNDLFPKSNLGWGPTECRPYNYKAFIIAARYFPRFGAEYVTKNPVGGQLITNYTEEETYKRDVSAFMAHAIQETGENDAHIYDLLPKDKAADCFYRGGFFNWFEGGPISPFVENNGLDPLNGKYCVAGARYCDEDTNNTYFYPCNPAQDGQWYEGCYYGRGAIQISYNFNYGLFGRWLEAQNITDQGEPIDILKHPNLVITKTDPPLSILASLWFYMTPQPPKPAMHDIVIGNWVSPDPSYAGGVFGPTSLVINKECNGEDPADPGRSGESRRIKAFRWFTEYFKVPFNDGDAKTLSCKTFNNGTRDFKFPKGTKIYYCWDVDWKTSWIPDQPCQCKMQVYHGNFAAYDPSIMPQYSHLNRESQLSCQTVYREGWRNQGCANATRESTWMNFSHSENYVASKLNSDK